MDTHFTEKIHFYAKRLADNAHSLVQDMTTNPAECYNSVVSKFVGGKRGNFSLRGGYVARCNGAVISFNCKESSVQEQIQKKIYGKPFKHFPKNY